MSKSGSQADIKKFQQTIGIRSDGLFGSDTAKRTREWKAANQQRIDELSGKISDLRREWDDNNNIERQRLRDLIADIRGAKTQAVKQRKIEVLKVIDEVRAKESPVVASAMAQIAQIRKSADDQIKASQKLINELRNTITVGGDEDVDAIVLAEQTKIKNANTEIDKLIEQKYALEASNRKLEAEVGPVKYIAEFVYGDKADANMLEEAVRWVILILVAVFDPLAVVLVLAGLTLLGRKPEETPPDDPPGKSEPEVEPTEEEHQEPEEEKTLAFITPEDPEEKFFEEHKAVKVEDEIDYNEHEPVIIRDIEEKVEEEEPDWDEEIKGSDLVELERMAEDDGAGVSDRTEPEPEPEPEILTDNKGSYVVLPTVTDVTSIHQKELNNKYKIDETIKR